MLSNFTNLDVSYHYIQSYAMLTLMSDVTTKDMMKQIWRQRVLLAVDQVGPR